MKISVTFRNGEGENWQKLYAEERIHQETKISLNNLNWIEDDKTEKLPAAVFLKGFIKAYLKCLCLYPVDDISNKYMSTLTRVEKK